MKAEELTAFATWIGENQFERNSLGYWSTIWDNNKFSDAQLTKLYLENPNAYNIMVRYNLCQSQNAYSL